MGVVTSFPVKDEFPLSCNKKDWMGLLIKKEPFNFGDLKLYDIVFPATHNSATYDVEPNLVSAVAKCQKDNISTQLASGVRLLDLRICDDTPDNIITISHRFLCGSLGEVFHQIHTFLRENPTELVIVAIKKDWDRELSCGGVNTVVNMIQNYFSDIFVTDEEVQKFSIKQLLELNKRILFISEDLATTAIPVSKMCQSWCDTNSASSQKLLRKLDEYSHKTEKRHLRVHDCYVTPNAESITKWCVKGVNWHQIQKDNNAKVFNWIREQTQGEHDFNIIALDMISQDLVDFIINLNPKKIS